MSNPDLISRTHARFLVENGHATSTSDVFDRLLGDGKPDSPHRWATLPDAVAWIRAAGGEMSRIRRYRIRPSNSTRSSASSRSRRAIEVVTGSHTPDQYCGRRTPLRLRSVARLGFPCARRGRAGSAACRRCRPTDSGLGTLALTPGGGLPPALPAGARIRFLPFTPPCPSSWIHPDNPQPRLIKQAVEIVSKGGVIAMPTDSSYALACHLDDKDASSACAGFAVSTSSTSLLVRDLGLANFAMVDNRQYRQIKSVTPGLYVFILQATCRAGCRTRRARRSACACPITRSRFALLESLGQPLLTTLILPPDDEPLNDPTKSASGSRSRSTS